MTRRKPGEWRPGDHGWIEHMTQRVDDLLKDRPELDNLLAGRPRGNYAQRTHEQLLGDVNQLYDKLVSLTKERDELRRSLSHAEIKLKSLSDRFWAVSAVVVAEGFLIGFLANQLFSRLH